MPLPSPTEAKRGSVVGSVPGLLRMTEMARFEGPRITRWTNGRKPGDSAGDLPRGTARRARTEECLGVAAIVGVRTIPDQRLRCEIQVPRPRHGAIPGADPAKQGVVRAEAIEDGAPQEVLDVALDDRSIRQRQSEAPTSERGGGSNADHHGRMLPQRRDPPQRQTGLRELPVSQKLVGVQCSPFDHEGMCSR